MRLYRSRLARLLAEHCTSARAFSSLAPTLMSSCSRGKTMGGRLKLHAFLPTLTLSGNYNRVGASERSGDGLATVLSGPPNPTWLGWFMGYPDGWLGSDVDERKGSVTP